MASSSAIPAENETSAAADLLVIILDTNPFAWHNSAQGDLPSADGEGHANNGHTNGATAPDSLSFDEALKSVLVICNAHMALRFENHVAVYAAGLGKSELLFSSVDAQAAQSKRSVGAVQLPPEPLESEFHESDSNTYQTFRIVNDAIAKGLRDSRIYEEQLQEGMQDKPIAFSSALSKALCHINRIEKDDVTPPLKARILVLSVSGETSTQYIPIMNCIFAAQKAAIPIDVCQVYGSDTVFLQQAAHLTKASYYRLERRSGLLQYLLMAFLPGPAIRKHLHLPTQDQIDLRAACFCHKKIVDIGYVCSVCLSIFCSPLPVCTTCRTMFPIKSLRRLMGGGGAAIGGPAPGTSAAARKRKAPGAAAGGATPAPMARPGTNPPSRSSTPAA